VLPELPSKMDFLDCENCPLLLLKRCPGESLSEYNKRWTPVREEIESRKRTLSKTKILKEDIIAAGWHPRRFEAWCLDEEEKKENEELFRF
jgi:hypothetical protein